MSRIAAILLTLGPAACTCMALRECVRAAPVDQPVLAGLTALFVLVTAGTVKGL